MAGVVIFDSEDSSRGQQQPGGRREDQHGPAKPAPASGLSSTQSAQHPPAQHITGEDQLLAGHPPVLEEVLVSPAW